MAAVTSLVLAAIVFGLAACSTLPTDIPKPAPEFASPPRPDGAFAEVEALIWEGYRADRSGFLLLDSNENALHWRLALVDSAKYTLDLQYFLWYPDYAGVLLMKRVVQAADRGVKVRLIVDDILTFGLDSTTVAIDAHPNIAIRLFNPWHTRPLLGRGVEFLEHLERLNQRMHNKQMIADNQAVILGGRNIGDDYFGLQQTYNFHDLDVLGVGSVARQASSIFDSFWNSDWVVPAAFLDVPGADDDLKALAGEASERLDAAKSLSRFSLEPKDWSEWLQRLDGKLVAGTSRMLTDSADQGALNHHMPGEIRALLATARRELLIVNAYIIPDDRTIETIRMLTERGVEVRILTNSLASHDVPAVNSHYKKWRKPLIQAGVELREIRPDAKIKNQIADTPPTVSEFMGLHTKAIVIDRHRVFIGSMNLDPRSIGINSEMGVLIESPGLGEALAELFERDMTSENSWGVTLDVDEELQWMSDDGVLTTQPARGFWQRIQDWFFVLFPKDYY
jgi:putative cardiolipin synthase